MLLLFFFFIENVFHSIPSVKCIHSNAIEMHKMKRKIMEIEKIMPISEMCAKKIAKIITRIDILILSDRNQGCQKLIVPQVN